MQAKVADPPGTPSSVEHDPPIPLRRVLREQIKQCCVGDADFNAFVLDYFPEVYGRFTGGMTRDDKINLLLEDEQKLPHIEKALSQLLALRTDKTCIAPIWASQTGAPRPRRGIQQQEICIEDDFGDLRPEKLAGLMEFIAVLVGRRYKVVIRNCRAGSVILTLRGDWRALTYLKDEFTAGRLRALNRRRVVSVTWALPAIRITLFESLRLAMLAQFWRGYLAIGRIMLWFARLAAFLRIPRWALLIAVVLTFSGVAVAAGELFRVLLDRPHEDATRFDVKRSANNESPYKGSKKGRNGFQRTLEWPETDYQDMGLDEAPADGTVHESELPAETHDLAGAEKGAEVAARAMATQPKLLSKDPRSTHDRDSAKPASPHVPVAAINNSMAGAKAAPADRRKPS